MRHQRQLGLPTERTTHSIDFCLPFESVCVRFQVSRLPKPNSYLTLWQRAKETDPHTHTHTHITTCKYVRIYREKHGNCTMQRQRQRQRRNEVNDSREQVVSFRLENTPKQYSCNKNCIRPNIT